MDTLRTNCIILNGLTSPPSDMAMPTEEKKRWINWIKEELEQRGIQTLIPNMPAPWQPVYQDWKNEFETLPVHENTILIGRSAAGAFLVRWLGENQQKIKKLILIAPGKKVNSNSEHAHDLYDFDIKAEIKERIGEIVIFTSPEEPFYRQENVGLYKNTLNARVISLPGKGHYVAKDLKSEKLPELLGEILK